jgi:hypothetical protein
VSDFDGITFGGLTIDEIARGAERSDPYTVQLDGLVLWRAKLGFEMAALTPRAQARVMGLTDGIPITYRPPPRPPGWTRHMLGVIEAERDRRRQRRHRR